MSTRLIQIEQQKQMLLAECAEHRALLAEAWRGLERPVALGHRAVEKLRSPWLWAGVGLVALKLPKRRLLRVPILLWKGWKMFRRARTMFG